MAVQSCPSCEQTITGLLDSIGRLRALTDEESKMLEAIIRRQTERDRLRHGTTNRCRVTFTPKIDRAIMAAVTPSQKRAVAERLGMSYQAVRKRQERLRKTLTSRADGRGGNAVEC